MPVTSRMLAAVAAASVLATVTPAPASAASTTTIEIPGFNYSPAVATVNVGDTVLFHQSLSNTTQHTTHTNGLQAFSFDIGLTEPGQTSVPILATTPGTFTYVCGFHFGMGGTLVVQPAPEPVVPEAPYAVLLALSGAFAICGGAFFVRRRVRPVV
jgi:plastocyanin